MSGSNENKELDDLRNKDNEDLDNNIDPNNKQIVMAKVLTEPQKADLKTHREQAWSKAQSAQQAAGKNVVAKAQNLQRGLM
jgi:hypothetical protein